ncbi:hypothetical protein CK203_021165 [Vitis vinifera]|uniref:Uncharacterized protein n=1 Tax=Vitis vinifera TaxID=29760 RepID=A0A438IMF9_VITVI|nr:hypothetical protein CK203_021165 [Vitis vinifera]
MSILNELKLQIKELPFHAKITCNKLNAGCRDPRPVMRKLINMFKDAVIQKRLPINFHTPFTIHEPNIFLKLVAQFSGNQVGEYFYASLYAGLYYESQNDSGSANFIYLQHVNLLMDKGLMITWLLLLRFTAFAGTGAQASMAEAGKADLILVHHVFDVSVQLTPVAVFSPQNDTVFTASSALASLLRVSDDEPNVCKIIRRFSAAVASNEDFLGKIYVKKSSGSMMSSAVKSGALVSLQDLQPSSPFFKQGASLRVTGK